MMSVGSGIYNGSTITKDIPDACQHKKEMSINHKRASDFAGAPSSKRCCGWENDKDVRGDQQVR
jgi:hypothetical protein